MTTTFFEKAFWVTVSLASVVRFPVTESGSIVGSRPLDQLIRERRSEGRNHGGGSDYSEQRLAGYRFGDEYFKDRSDESEQASENAQISENDKAATNGADGCERVVKDSMICMLCEDPKTHSKYEQCSYVARPHENIQSYASSKSYPERPTASSHRNKNNQRERDESSSGEQRNNDEASAGEKTSSVSQEESSDEMRASGYSSDNDDDDEQAKSYHDDYYGRNEHRLGSSSSHETPDDRRAHRPKSLAGNKANCREVRKDSMTCTICKDADNGGNFEKCSYTHQPNDKLYKYSKSKSFGYPGESSGARETKRVDKIADPPASGNDSPRQCQRFRKNSSTICNICRDTVTAEKFQECEYNLKPQHAERRQISRTAR